MYPEHMKALVSTHILDPVTNVLQDPLLNLNLLGDVLEHRSKMLICHDRLVWVSVHIILGKFSIQLSRNDVRKPSHSTLTTKPLTRKVE